MTQKPTTARSWAEGAVRGGAWPLCRRMQRLTSVPGTMVPILRAISRGSLDPRPDHDSRASARGPGESLRRTPPPPGSPPRPKSRRSTRRGCPAFACHCGMVFGCRRARRRTSIAKLNAAAVAALADPGLRARLADLGQEIFPRDQQTPEAIRALQKAEIKSCSSDACAQAPKRIAAKGRSSRGI
jgi:hypothetical protein